MLVRDRFEFEFKFFVRRFLLQFSFDRKVKQNRGFYRFAARGTVVYAVDHQMRITNVNVFLLRTFYFVFYEIRATQA